MTLIRSHLSATRTSACRLSDLRPAFPKAVHFSVVLSRRSKKDGFPLLAKADLRRVVSERPLSRQLGLIAGGTVALDGSRFRAVNARDRNFTPVTIRRRMEQVDASIQRYLGMLDTADRQEGEATTLRTTRLSLCGQGGLLMTWFPDIMPLVSQLIG